MPGLGLWGRPPVGARPPGRARSMVLLSACLLLLLLTGCERHNSKAAQRDGRLIHQKLRHGQLKEVLESSRKSAAIWRDQSFLRCLTSLSGCSSRRHFLLSPMPPPRTQFLLTYNRPPISANPARPGCGGSPPQVRRGHKAGPVLDRGLQAAQRDGFDELQIDAYNLKGSSWARAAALPRPTKPTGRP